LPCIETAAGDVVLAPFVLTLDTLCDWRKQQLWLARPDATPAALLDLVSQLQQHLLACGLQPEPRRYRPHVTLARKMDDNRKKALARALNH
jgi:2'-5' RNA ligase